MYVVGMCFKRERATPARRYFCYFPLSPASYAAGCMSHACMMNRINTSTDNYGSLPTQSTHTRHTRTPSPRMPQLFNHAPFRRALSRSMVMMYFCHQADKRVFERKNAQTPILELRQRGIDAQLDETFMKLLMNTCVRAVALGAQV